MAQSIKRFTWPDDYLRKRSTRVKKLWARTGIQSIQYGTGTVPMASVAQGNLALLAARDRGPKVVPRSMRALGTTAAMHNQPPPFVAEDHLPRFVTQLGPHTVPPMEAAGSAVVRVEGAERFAIKRGFTPPPAVNLPTQ